MPTPVRALARARLSRRGALGAGVVVAGSVLAACTGSPEGSHPSGSSGSPTPGDSGRGLDPDVVVAAEALTAQAAMVDLLRGTIERHPRLAVGLQPVREAHEAHASLLADAVPEGGSAAPSPSTDGRGGRRTGVARRAERAVADVVRAEQELVTATTQQALRAQSGSFARVLGSIAASAAQHAVLVPAALGGAAR